MSKDHGTPSGAFVNFLAAIVKATPRDLSDDLMELWSKRNSRELARRLREVLGKYPRCHLGQCSIPVSNSERPLHKDIRIEFIAGSRKYVALGYLGEREDKVDYQTAIERTNVVGTTGVFSEDCSLIIESCPFLPLELFKFGLVTQLCVMGPPEMACYLSREEEGEKMYHQSWMGLDDNCFYDFLVLRRVLNF